MNETWRINIAGLSIDLHDTQAILAELQVVYRLFRERGDAFKADDRNPHLCRAGCSHCCKSGAVFAVSLVEAIQWSLAIEALPAAVWRQSRDQATRLLEQQRRVFAEIDGPADVPGSREEPFFSTRVSKLNVTSPMCPLLFDDLCGVYEDRPMLCRAYGFPVDSYSVQASGTIVFRSLCVLYEGMQLADYVRAKDLKGRIADLSCRLGGGRDWGRFTSPEAILSQVEHRPAEKRSV